MKFAESVKIVELPGLPEKGDVADFLKDRTAEDLKKAIASAPRFRRVEVKPGDVPFFVSPAKILPKDAPSVGWLIPGAIHRGATGLIRSRPKQERA